VFTRHQHAGGPKRTTDRRNQSSLYDIPPEGGRPCGYHARAVDACRTVPAPGRLCLRLILRHTIFERCNGCSRGIGCTYRHLDRGKSILGSRQASATGLPPPSATALASPMLRQARRPPRLLTASDEWIAQPSPRAASSMTNPCTAATARCAPPASVLRPHGEPPLMPATYISVKLQLSRAQTGPSLHTARCSRLELPSLLGREATASTFLLCLCATARTAAARHAWQLLPSLPQHTRSSLSSAFVRLPATHLCTPGAASPPSAAPPPASPSLRSAALLSRSCAYTVCCAHVRLCTHVCCTCTCTCCACSGCSCVCAAWQWQPR
jgi:hypothetical protein